MVGDRDDRGIRGMTPAPSMLHQAVHLPRWCHGTDQAQASRGEPMQELRSLRVALQPAPQVLGDPRDDANARVRVLLLDQAAPFVQLGE